MAGINKVIIVGNLGNNPEVRTMPNGEAVANISVATSESWQDKQTGERREVTEWHRIVFYRRQAEVAGQYLRKGSKVYVEGRLRTRKWQDQNGQDRYTTEIQGDVLQMLDSRSDRAGYQEDNTGFANNGGYNSSTQYSGNQYANNNQGGYSASAQNMGYAQQNNVKPAPQAEPPMDNFDDDIPF